MTRRFCIFLIMLAAVLSTVSTGPAAGQEEAGGDSVADKVPDMKWVHGPAVGKLGDKAKIEIPEGFVFADGAGTKKFLEITQNFPSGGELGMIAKETLEWFVVFEFEDVGYVKDSDKDKLDADKLMETMKANNVKGNEERKSRGWGELTLLGWEVPPQYSRQTNNLEWATKLQSGGEGITVNHNTRLLGRKGVMNVTLVADQEAFHDVLASYRTLIAGFSYVQGNRYAEYVRGDKVAKYGLSALVLGGATAAAAKSGLLGKLWKLIAAGIIAIGAFLKGIFNKISGRKQSERQQQPAAEMVDAKEENE